MLRNSAVRRIKPMVHGFSPGGRASEKGTLYRNNNANMYSRIAPIQISQRTTWESQTFLLLMVPDQIFSICFLAACCGVGWFAAVWSRQHSDSVNKGKFLSGTMTEDELYARNDDMSRIFKKHEEEIANSRAETVEPPTFRAPPTYTSSSGRFSATQ